MYKCGSVKRILVKMHRKFKFHFKNFKLKFSVIYIQTNQLNLALTKDSPKRNILKAAGDNFTKMLNLLGFFLGNAIRLCGNGIDYCA